MEGLKLYEQTSLVARIKTQTVSAAATAESDVIDTRYWREITVYVNMGAYASGNDGSLACAVYGDTASGGSFATSLKALTTATFTGSTGDESIGIIHLRMAEFDTYRYMRVKLTPTNKDLAVGVIVLGNGTTYKPANTYNLAAVTELKD